MSTQIGTFAAHALQGMLANPECDHEGIEKAAWKKAQKMMWLQEEYENANKKVATKKR